MTVIGIWGDSMAWGAYDRELGGWTLRLRRYWDDNYQYGDNYNGGPSVYNLGVYGDKVANVLARFDAEYAARKPGIVILAVGINDSPHHSHPDGTPLSEFEEDFRKLVAKAKAKTTDVIVLSPTNVINSHPRNYGYRNETIQPYTTAIHKIVEDMGVRFVDLFGVLANEDLEMDGLHPLDTGHEKIFQEVKALLTR